MSARRFVFESECHDDGTPRVVRYAYLWPDDLMVQVSRRTTIGGRESVHVNVRVYGQLGFDTEATADEFEDALTEVEARMRALCPTAWAFYAKHVFVGAENPETVQVAA